MVLQKATEAMYQCAGKELDRQRGQTGCRDWMKQCGSDSGKVEAVCMASTDENSKIGGFAK